MKLIAATPRGQTRLDNLFTKSRKNTGLINTVSLFAEPGLFQHNMAQYWTVDTDDVFPKTYGVRQAGSPITLQDGKVARYFETIRDGKFLFIEDPAVPVCEFRKSMMELTFIKPSFVSLKRTSYVYLLDYTPVKHKETASRAVSERLSVNGYVFEIMYSKRPTLYADDSGLGSISL